MRNLALIAFLLATPAWAEGDNIWVPIARVLDDGMRDTALNALDFFSKKALESGDTELVEGRLAQVTRHIWSGHVLATDVPILSLALSWSSADPKACQMLKDLTPDRKDKVTCQPSKPNS
jgi:hypothetical protein